jgi:hypothetical protein
MRKSDSLFGGARALPKFDKENDRVVLRQLAALGYVDDYGSDGGSGSALDSITNAAATLGSAYIISNAQRNNSVNVPTRTNPAYGSATSGPSGSVLIVVVLVLFAAVGGLFYAMKG